jgi:hypothetical protein
MPLYIAKGAIPPSNKRGKGAVPIEVDVNFLPRLGFNYFAPSLVDRGPTQECPRKLGGILDIPKGGWSVYSR